MEAAMDLDEAAKAFREFVGVIKALRTPGTGCPWDLEQDHRTLRPFLVEEACEVVDAIDRGDDSALCEELGDLLLQAVLHAQVADDRGAFSITEVARGIAEKMVRRHPHVFGEVRVGTSAEVKRNWESIKAAEHQAKGHDASPASALGRIPESMPALLRATRLGEKAAKAGLGDGPYDRLLLLISDHVITLQGDARTAMESIGREPVSAADAARRMHPDLRHQVDFILGELLFAICQLARLLGLNAEDSLRACSRRFIESFQGSEPTA
jgi:MazG family protein